MNDVPIRLGIIGTGTIAGFLAKDFAAIPGVRLAACLNPDPEQARAFVAANGIEKVVMTLEDLWPLVDAVHVASPDRFHATQTLAALAAGKHVLCEKPISVTLAEAHAMAAAAAQAASQGIVTVVDFAHRRKPALEHAAALIADGAIGSLRHVDVHYLQSWQCSPMWGNWWDPGWVWRLDGALSGGALTNLGSHAIDALIATAGPVRRVMCATGTWPKRRDGVELMACAGHRLDANDSAVVTLELADGALGCMQLSQRTIGMADRFTLDLYGTDGAISLDLERSPHRLARCSGAGIANAGWHEFDCTPALSIAQRFIAAIRSRHAVQPDISCGAEVQGVLSACASAAASGRWEEVSSLPVSAFKVRRNRSEKARSRSMIRNRRPRRKP